MTASTTAPATIAPAASASVELDGVVKSYGAHRALDGIRLALDPGEFVALLGPSGCGKTTALRALAGLESIDEGRIDIDGTRRATATEKRPEAWLMRVEQLGHGVVTDDALTSEERGDEYLLMGLRLREGIDPQRYRALAGRTLDQARIELLRQEGAIVVDGTGRVVAARRNESELTGDPTAHAEVLALRTAAEATGDWRLTDCTLVVTLEPCVMCAGAILSARIATLVFGAWDEKAGAAGSLWDVVRDRRLNHRPEVIPGVLEADCADRLTAFFRDR